MDIEASVMYFVAEFTAVQRERLSLTTTLLGDLGIDGADGWELMEAFGEKFRVDLSAFRADRHFGPEGLPIHAPFAWLLSWITSPFRERETPEERAGLKPIRISDLIAAAREGRWAL